MYNKPNSAIAYIKGCQFYPSIKGVVALCPMGRGTWVCADIRGLPEFSRDNNNIIGPHGFHIHETADFSPSDRQYNPADRPFGNHAGDFPMLFSNHGIAKLEFYTDKFAPHQIINKSVIINEGPDDYYSLFPNSGNVRIACGVVERA